MSWAAICNHKNIIEKDEQPESIKVKKRSFR